MTTVGQHQRDCVLLEYMTGDAHGETEFKCTTKSEIFANCTVYDIVKVFQLIRHGTFAMFGK